uniref:Prolyl 4-hydroxylase alpha-subunit N-terminal domain-containing protein n=1 Tax=Clastoptera arizonana TaxID=38151 RepID=A0A1B6CVA8_9HEMI
MMCGVMVKSMLSVVLVILSCLHRASTDYSLYNVDKSIMKFLSHPEQLKNGFELLSNINLYSKTLDKILQKLKERDDSVIKITNILWEINGPRFLLKDIDDIRMQKVWKWRVDDFTIMYEKLNEVQRLWREVRLEYLKLLIENFQLEKRYKES